MGFGTVLTQFWPICTKTRAFVLSRVPKSGLESMKPSSGRLAQLVRAPALQAGGRRFESCTAHHRFQSVSAMAAGIRF